ncbi:2-keto-myo-inositol isomerase [Neorhodopirellula lusitana]|uniref:2-keto-myo-inositol isomerase n=1 Tax=Neorhodopirellula lusitana TaxID=445327 RepID=A0ABY1PVU9_9BACT|nr:sugar phosphate isomerase/epimerase family protein [Neorhodopirellula lusitana]SMP46165.1 2-keto-myo-inositol isomerase [Neorhodopirellula lusitana]
MSIRPNRRQFARACGLGILATGAVSTPLVWNPTWVHAGTGVESTAVPPIALNTSTLRGHQLSVPDQVQVVADAGYDGIEPWIRDLRQFVDGGGKLTDLKKQLDDAGLQMSGAIGFAKWIVEDPQQRAAGLEEARRDMAMVRELGGVRMAAPPIGAHNADAIGGNGGLDLNTVASRYRALLEVGKEMGVTPLLELWGFSPTLSQLSELAYVSTAAKHPDAAVLPDFYHIYKGGNDMVSLGMIEASRMPLFHINDYPAEPPIAEIADRDRVFPGDGVCPLVETIAMLLRNGFAGTFSLELFNPEYWKRPAAEVASEGYQKSKRVIDQAIAMANH